MHAIFFRVSLSLTHTHTHTHTLLHFSSTLPPHQNIAAAAAAVLPLL